MNILFVHYGTFAANSMNHIGPFASELKKQGHETAITLPELDPTFRFFPFSQVPAYPFEEMLKDPFRFDGEAPDIVHVWTPRDVVRKFCEKLWEKIEARCIIHLEDDEEAVRNEFPSGQTDSESRMDPLHGPRFLETADAFTVIIETLSSNVPFNKPQLCLYPGFDKSAAEKNPEPRFKRSDFAIPEEYKIITYPGGASGPNSGDLVELYNAVHLLNEHGSPCLLLKTGFPDPHIRSTIVDGAENWIRDLGYLPREQLWRFIELADVVVQPGQTNNYNQKRLPSKLPDFLCLGKPVITSMQNFGQILQDGKDALLLKTSSANEIAARCQELFSNPGLATKIAAEGQKTGQQWFDLTKNTIGLRTFYEDILKSNRDGSADYPGDQIEIALSSLEDELEEIAPPSNKALKLKTFIKAVRKAEKKKKPDSKKDTATQVEMQIFFPNAPEKLELCSLRRWYSRGRPQCCLIPFSPPENLDWIRIDPGQYPGTYFLKSWALLDAHQSTLYEWTPELKLTDTCQLNGVTAGPVTPQGQEIWSLTHDPQLLFAPLEDIDSKKVHWFKIELAVDEVESPLTKKLKLKPRSPTYEDEMKDIRNKRIDRLLRKLERRRSPVLRFYDRIRKR